jgi:hypothetical protein
VGWALNYVVSLRLETGLGSEISTTSRKMRLKYVWNLGTNTNNMGGKLALSVAPVTDQTST